jgi:hypothetical protein
VASLVQLMVEYPAHIQELCSDLRRGIPSKTKYMPTVAELVALADGFVREEAETAKFNKRFSGRIIPKERKPFRPFPQLWAAFGNDVMDEVASSKGMDFDRLDAACKALVTEGRFRAETMLGINIPDAMKRAAE